MLLIMLLLLPLLTFAEKLYVVERERGSLAAIEDGRLIGRIEGLGNLNHATVKFYRNFAYVISRDGFLSKIDTREDRLIERVKVGESGIGLDFFEGYVLVANYEPDTVVVLDENLKIVETLKTGSRNVGIKAFSSGFVFSLMDKDEIWVMKGKDIKKYEKVGSMPFDALLYRDKYLVGFFKDPFLGLLDLKSGEYRKIPVGGQGEVPFKIPHFGTWGIVDSLAYVPAVGERALYLLNMEKLRVEGKVLLSGLPVFAAASPNKRYIAVNFSGDREDYVALVDTVERRVVMEALVGKRVMHLRFSKDGKRLYISSYFDSKLRILSIPNLGILQELDLYNPSGIFVLP